MAILDIRAHVRDWGMSQIKHNAIDIIPLESESMLDIVYWKREISPPSMTFPKWLWNKQRCPFTRL